MWLGKFLDLKEDLKSMASDIRNKILETIKKTKLTPLEFTILETIINNRELSGYDLIQNLNRHFAGTWQARSGTIYPILSKLKHHGFLKIKQIKSEIGPLKKVYFLTDSGEQIIKVKVNKNFFDQIKFIENFLVELATIYIRSSPNEDIEKAIEERIDEVQELFKGTFDRIIKVIPANVAFKIICPKCNVELERSEAAFCAYCGTSLYSKGDSEAEN